MAPDGLTNGPGQRSRTRWNTVIQDGDRSPRVYLRQQLFLEYSFNDLPQTSGHLTAEEPAQDRDISRRMQHLGINGHLNPKPDAIQFHPTPVGCPLDSLDHRPELGVDLIDSAFKAPACFC
jgi:hypothetical protein